MKKKNEFDIIIVGSGISALTCASLLTKLFYKKVLVLEQHYVAGGLTHEFRRKKYRWDVGVHYVGGVEEGSLGRNLFDFITEKKLEWEKLPYHFEHYIYPDFKFKVPSNPKRFEKALIREFPFEKEGILKYFKDIKEVSFWHIQEMILKNSNYESYSLEAPVGSFGKNLSLITTQDYLNFNFKDEKLKSLLTSQWGNYGLLPCESSFALHALTVYSYFRGAYFPSGGAEQIAKSIIPIIEKGGGRVLTRHEVKKIILKDERVQGVFGYQKKNSKEFFYECSQVISSAGMINTAKMLPDSSSLSFLQKFEKKGYSALVLYVGFKEDPRKLGVEGENIWIHPGYNHNKNLYKNLSDLKDKFPFLFLSFPSLKKKGAKGHTAEIVTLIDYDLFERWEKTSWSKRGGEYQKIKKTIEDNFIEVIESYYPGFKSLIDYSEVGTPLTLEHFSYWPKGAFYGLPGNISRYSLTNKLKIKSPIEGLYFTGSDVSVLGVVGAALGGMATAGKIGSITGLEDLLMKFSPQFGEKLVIDQKL